MAKESQNNKIVGHVPAVKEGGIFKDRMALREAGVHLPNMDGIDGRGHEGARSIVLNGGYVDDQDFGDEIIYTGHGGNDPNSKKQVEDQSWDAYGNKALIVSELKGLPIRVTRGFKHKSSLSPATGYRYDGLYLVTDHFEDVGKDGFKICRFKLRKIGSIIGDVASENPTKNLDLQPKTPDRIPTTILRIVRDTSLAKIVKGIYDYTCQVCRLRITVRDVPYAEAAHVRPLGRPHDGKDDLSNLLCLCPNHHLMFDKGVFSIAANFKLIGGEGSLHVHDSHPISLEALAYHNKHIYIND